MSGSLLTSFFTKHDDIKKDSFFFFFLAAYRLSLVVASGVYSFVAVRGLLIAVASLVAEHGL